MRAILLHHPGITKTLRLLLPVQDILGWLYLQTNAIDQTARPVVCGRVPYWICGSAVIAVAVEAMVGRRPPEAAWPRRKRAALQPT